MVDLMVSDQFYELPPLLRDCNGERSARVES